MGRKMVSIGSVCRYLSSQQTEERGHQPCKGAPGVQEAVGCLPQVWPAQHKGDMGPGCDGLWEMLWVSLHQELYQSWW